MTFYLKYRPKTIEELDLASVRERMTELIKHKKFSHAYLFSGPRGTGKTSTARILAREMGAVGMDVIEMDAASNRGIDDIRELRERVGLSAAEGEKKVYIIDEVHMLTTEAFNALLKTLEEPPSHVTFFLCTTELEKVPATIVSRCVSIPFQKATTEEIVRSLARTAKGEKLSIEKGALELIASSVDGSFREAQTILEEASVDGNVSVTQAEKAMGGSLTQLTAQYVDAAVSGDAQAALKAVAVVVENGGDIGLFSRNILQTVRTRLLRDIQSERLLGVAKIIEERVRTIQYAPLPELSLEIAAIELNRDKKGRSSPDISEVARTVSDKTVRVSRVASMSLYQFLEKWPEILSGVKEKNHGIVTLLSHCKPVGIEGNTVTIEVSYQFHKDQLLHDRYRQLVEGVIGDVCGSKLIISYALAPKTERVLKEFPIDDNIRAAEESELVSVAEELFT